MYVLGQTSLDLLEIYYDDGGGPWPADKPVGDAAGCIRWFMRPLRGIDRQLFAKSEDGDDTERQGMIQMTDHVEGLAAADGKELTTITTDTFDQLDGWIIGLVMRRITARMEETQKVLGEYETPSDS